MRRLQSLNPWSMLAAAGVLASIATAQPTLTQLNSGPSSNTIPSGDDSTVLTFAVPRVVVATTVAEVPSGTLNGTAGANSSLTVQTSGGAGFRNRSRAELTNNLDTNAAAVLQLIGNPNAAGVAASSHLYIFKSSDIGTGVGQIGDSIADLLTYLGAKVSGTDYFDIPFTAMAAVNTDAEVEEADLQAGVNITNLEINTATPAVGAANTWRFNPAFDVFLVALDTGGTTDPEVVTEFGYIRRPPATALATDAATGVSDTTIPDLRILANQQLVDDLTADNPGDTTVASLTAADDFLIATSAAGAGAQPLSTYLATLTGAPTVTGITIGGTSNSDFNRILTLALSAPITNTTDIAALRSRFVTFTPGGGEVFTVPGGTTGNQYVQLDKAADLTITSAKLLQGSGNNTHEIWVAVDASGDITNPGTSDQFELVVTRDGTTSVVATGVALPATTTVPTTGDVAGIDDLNLDGTTTDPVIAAAGNRFFVQFTLDDTDDSINSDATWSDEGAVERDGRDERFAITLRRRAGGTAASNALGSGIGSTAMSAVDDLARPLIVGYRTAATGTNDPLGLCETADQLHIVFDEEVALNTTPANRLGVRYNPGADISDLTAGLDSSFSVPVAVAAASSATLEGLVTTPTPALFETHIERDTVAIDSPLIPLTEPAQDGTAAATGIRPGTGFVGGDSPYKLAADNNLVTTTGIGGAVLGNVITTGATFASNALTGGGVNVVDGAPLTLVEADGVGAGAGEDLTEVRLGFSEDGSALGVTTTEAESYIFIMENDTVGRRVSLGSSSIFFNGDNTATVSLAGSAFLDGDTAADPGYVVAINNPGFPIFDGPGNRVDFNISKTKMVLIGRPSAEFKDVGIASVDPETDKVVSFMLKVTGEVALSDDGDIDDLLERFYVRGGVDLNGNGNFTDPGESSGEPLQASGLVDSVEIGDEADSDGCYTLTFTFMEGMPFTQDNFAVQYVDSGDQASPADTTLVDASQENSEIPSALISVRVLRPPVIEGDDPGSEGNVLGMTFGGTLDLGDEDNAELGAEITAFVWSPYGNSGFISFTYKGQRYEGLIDLATAGSSSGVANGSVLYFHPQISGPGGFGTMSPCGVINSCPDLDLYATAALTSTTNGNQNGFPVNTMTTNNVLIYQNLAKELIVNPVQLTFARSTVTTTGSGNVGAFTVTGTGITNGRVVSDGEFIEIGSTIVTGPEDSNGARSYTLHTAGDKAFRGLPVVLVVDPEDFFNDSDCLLANNFFAGHPSGPVLFTPDIDRKATTGTTAAPAPVPFIFNIDQDAIFSHDVSDLVFQSASFGDAWGGFGLHTNNSGRDYGTTLPNRFSAPNTANPPVLAPINGSAATAFPSVVDARGMFVFLNKGTCLPYLPNFEMALVIDNTGVFCDDITKLNRLVSGYSVFISFDQVAPFTSSDCWFTFGTDLSTISGGTLSVGGTSATGNWATLVNYTGEDVEPTDLPFPLVFTITGDNGVRMGGTAAGDFADLETVFENEAILTNQASTTTAFPN